MEHVYYVRRAKNKVGIERHDTLHAADDNKTLCGKKLNEMWFIEPAHNLKPEDVNCISCRRSLRCLIVRRLGLMRFRPGESE